ncbi:MAG: YncE family protein [Ignavibacteria bacterium]|jgi:DNA-binding beta-propeller fold protein YncE
MRSFILACAFALTCTTSLAQNKVVTPPLPSAVFFDDGLAHILCTRLDADYDSESDTGDVAASWLVIDPATLSVVRSQQFEWKDVKVTRSGSSLEKDVLDVVVGEEVIRYQTSTLAPLGKLFEGKIYGLDASQDVKTLWMSERPSFTEPGNVIEYNIDSKQTVKIPVGINPQQVSYHQTADGLEQVLVICEELFGKSNGTFRIVDLKTTPRTQKAIEVGDTPNYFVTDGDTAYVVVNGSHTVVIVDLVRHEKIGTINVGTTGFDGPREAAIWFDPTSKSKMLLVSTFDEEIRVYNLQTREHIKSIRLDAKPEGIALRGNDLWVTQTFRKDTYDPATDVAIYDLLSAVSVNDYQTPAMPKGVLSISGAVRLPFAPGSSVTITDITGRQTPLSAVVSGSQTVDCSGLPHGTYLLSNGKESIKLMR